MLKWLGKLVVEKIVGLVIFLLGVGVVVLVWQYRHALPTWGGIGHFLGSLLLWVAIATVLPWGMFFLVWWVQRAENNLPAVGLLLVWAAVDCLAAWWLTADVHGGLRVFAVALAFCASGLYNLIAANQIAKRRPA